LLVESARQGEKSALPPNRCTPARRAPQSHILASLVSRGDVWCPMSMIYFLCHLVSKLDAPHAVVAKLRLPAVPRIDEHILVKAASGEYLTYRVKAVGYQGEDVTHRVANEPVESFVLLEVTSA